MPDSERTTKVMVADVVRFGTFANAFRVVEEVGPDCFLDFMVYSAAEQQATVVARVRVRRDFIPAIRDNLGEALSEFQEASDSQIMSSIVFRKTDEPVH